MLTCDTSECVLNSWNVWTNIWVKKIFTCTILSYDTCIEQYAEKLFYTGKKNKKKQWF